MRRVVCLALFRVRCGTAFSGRLLEQDVPVKRQRGIVTGVSHRIFVQLETAGPISREDDDSRDGEIHGRYADHQGRQLSSLRAVFCGADHGLHHDSEV